MRADGGAHTGTQHIPAFQVALKMRDTINGRANRRQLRLCVGGVPEYEVHGVRWAGWRGGGSG